MQMKKDDLAELSILSFTYAVVGGLCARPLRFPMLQDSSGSLVSVPGLQDASGLLAGLQDTSGLLSVNGFVLPPKLAEKRKLIEEIAHNDVKKVSTLSTA